MKTKKNKTTKIEITNKTSNFMKRMLYTELATQRRVIRNYPAVLQEDGTDKNWSKRNHAETRYDKAFLAFQQLFGCVPVGHEPSRSLLDGEVTIGH